jgi:hypothetical protein
MNGSGWDLRLGKRFGSVVAMLKGQGERDALHELPWRSPGLFSTPDLATSSGASSALTLP